MAQAQEDESYWYNEYLKEFCDISEARAAILRDRTERARTRLGNFLLNAEQDSEFDDPVFLPQFAILVEKYLFCVNAVSSHESDLGFPKIEGNC